MLKGAHGLTLSKADYWAVYLTFSPEFFSQLFSLFILESGIGVRVRSHFYLCCFTWIYISQFFSRCFDTWMLLRHTWPKVLVQKNQNFPRPWGKSFDNNSLRLPLMNWWVDKETCMKNLPLWLKQILQKGNKMVDREGIWPSSKISYLQSFIDLRTACFLKYFIVIIWQNLKTFFNTSHLWSINTRTETSSGWRFMM